MTQSVKIAKIRNAERKSGKLYSHFAIILFLSILAIPAANASNDSAPEKLSQVEKLIVGSENIKGSIDQRLKTIELKVYGKVQSGSMTSRIAALEKFAGVNRSDFMPPIPPQFDNGKGPL